MSISDSPPVRVIGLLKPHRVPYEINLYIYSMLNFIQVSFCFLLFLGLGLGSVIGLRLGFRV